MAVTDPNRQRKSRRLPMRLSLAALCLGILVVIVGAVVVRVQFQAFTVSSDSMSPSMMPGQLAVTQKVATADLRRGDVVVVDAAEWNMRGTVVKRVIGVGGDRISCCALGQLTVNGRAVAESFAPSVDGGLPGYSVTIPPGRVFLLGDNRADSIDSRMFLAQAQGSLPASAVRARIIWTAAKGGSLSSLPTALLTCAALVLFGLLSAVLGLTALIVTLIVSRRRAQPFIEQQLPASVGED